MVSSILLLFSDPDGFFRRDPKEWSGLAVPASIVLVAGVLAALGAYLVSRLISGLLPEGIAGVPATGSIMGIAGAGGAFLGTFLGWFLIAAVFYVISMLFMGKGTFTRTLAGVGYGFIPTVIGNLISLVLLWYYLPGIQVAPVRDIMDIQEATLAITRAPVFQMSTILGIIFLIWSASLWIFALRYSRELTPKHAAITVGIPVLLYIISIVILRVVFP